MRFLLGACPYFFRVAILPFLLLAVTPLRAITFKSAPLIPTPMDISLLVSADVNGDGKPDLLYVDGSGGQKAVHILLSNGNGTFTHAYDIALPTGVCCALTIADVTGDGKPDLLLVGNSSTAVILAVYPGNGDGTFQLPILSSYTPAGFDGFPRFVCPMGVGDINSDGKMDLVVLDGSAADLLPGNGAGGFTYEQSIQLNVNEATADLLYLQDLNGDGHPDILVTDPIGADFRVLLGNGDGTFATPVTYSLGTPAGPFLLVDVDGDGHPDVLTVYYDANRPYQLGYLKGNPDGTFSTLNGLGASPVQNQPLVLAKDVNGDGLVDLFFLTPSGLAVCLGQAGLSFGAPLTTISGGSMSPYTTLPTTLIVADFNEDGHNDVAMAVEGGIALLFGNGNGTFASDDFYDVGHPVGSAAVAKFSGSGNMDIAVSLPATFPRLLLGDGKGNFTLGPDPNPIYGSQAPVVTVLAADFNGDGKPDLNLGNMIPNTPSSASQSVAFNQGNGVFSAPVAVPSSSPIMADLNGDGHTDMVYAAGMTIVSSLGQTNGSFTAVTTSLRVPFDTGLFNVGDVNNDGKPDLVLNYRDHLEIWTGNGDGSFTFFSAIPLQEIQNGAVTVGDVDGDHNADIVLSPEADVEALLGPIAILYGNGNGTFQSPVFLPTTRRFYDVVLADVNHDNLPDFVMTDGATVAVILNLGGRSFGPETDYVAGRSIQGLNVVDVNSDGYPDIVVANGDGYVDVSGPDFSGTTVVVLLNEPNATSPVGAAVTGSLSVAPSSPLIGQAITINLTVSGGSSASPVPTGSVSFSVDGVFLGDGTLTNGSVNFPYSGFSVATSHTITASYNGDNTYAPASFSTLIVVRRPTYTTVTALTVTPSTVLAGNTIRLSATVTSTAAVSGGVLTFLDGGNSIGSAEISSSGFALFDTNLLAPGAHNLTAEFQGYASAIAIFSPSTSSVVPVAITTDATTVSLSPSATSATAGTVLTFTAQAASAAGVPFGSTSFYDGNALLATLALDAQGQGSYSTASLSAGTHSITAVFNANGPYGGAVSAPQSISINPAPATATATYVALALEMGSAVESFSLKATVSSDAQVSGVVTFLDSGKVLGTAEVNSLGVAVLPLTGFASGAHRLTASFEGASSLAPSVSPALTEQWAAVGPGFSLQIGGNSGSTSVSLQIHAVPIANFSEPVALSCTSGLPPGYECEFSPEVLSNGIWNSTLRVTPSRRASMSRVRGKWLTMPLFFAALLIWVYRGNRRVCCALVLCGAAGLVGGCAVSPSPVQVTVLTVQASAGSGSQEVVQSVQWALKLRADR